MNKNHNSVAASASPLDNSEIKSIRNGFQIKNVRHVYRTRR
jgi:hypothetical protein